MKTTEQEKWAKIAEQLNILQVSAADVFMLGLGVIKATGITRSSGLKKARRLIRLGEEALQLETHTVTFLEAYNDMIESKKEKIRPASMRTVKALLSRIMKKNKGLCEKKMRSITTNDCKKILENSFQTSRQFFNGRAILSSLFGHAKKRGWVATNPVSGVDTPVIKEKKIKALGFNDCQTLIALSQQMYNNECAVPAAILLFTGIRPTELTRIRWKDIHTDEKIISISAVHSKTGGARHVSIQKPLQNIIKSFKSDESADALVVPKNWGIKWREIRREFSRITGITWQADVLRHSFASYYLKHYKDLPSLQLEMGHSNLQQLRTRYLNMEGISTRDACKFWAMAW